MSTESGGSEIYVQALDGASARHQVSARGGVYHLWAPAGRRVYYHGSTEPGRPVGIWVVDIGDPPEYRASIPRLILPNPGYRLDAWATRRWSIHPQR